MGLRLKQGLYSFILVFITYWCSKYFTDIGLENFYDILELPEKTPKNSYFSNIWNILYILLFLSFYIILATNKTREQFLDANALFIMQLFLQILWTFSFFFMEQLGASAIVLILLDMLVLLTLHTFSFINLWGFILLIPYFIWLLFATYLNIYIAIIN